jgi:hypothetical protein
MPPHVPDQRRTGWRTPYSFTALAPVAAETLVTVSERLDTEAPGMAAAVAAVGGLHSFRILLVADPEDHAGGAQLLLNGVHDGAGVGFLRELVATVGAALGRICEPLSGSLLEGESLVSWLHARRHVEATFHIGIVGRTVDDIRSEQRLRDLLQEVVDDQRSAGWTNATPAETIRRTLRDHLLGLGDPGLPRGPLPKLSLGARLSKLASMAWALANPTSGLLVRDLWHWTGRKPFATRWLLRAILVPWGLYTLIPTLLWLLAVRYLEITEPDEPTPVPDPAALQALMESEDLQLMNQLTMYLPVRNSRIRRWMMRRVLSGAQRGSQHLWNTGRLAGIGTIHFARFLQTHRGSRMMFLSDYDGSWDRYLSEFLSLGSRAVLPIWANCQGCPKTRWMFGITAGFAPRFLALTRSHQAPAPLWYNAFPGLSVSNMVNNAHLREGLFVESMTEADARAWCERL